MLKTVLNFWNDFWSLIILKIFLKYVDANDVVSKIEVRVFNALFFIFFNSFRYCISNSWRNSAFFASIAEDSSFLSYYCCHSSVTAASAARSHLSAYMLSLGSVSNSPPTVGLIYNRQLVKFFVPLKNRYAVKTDGIKQLHHHHEGTNWMGFEAPTS